MQSNLGADSPIRFNPPSCQKPAVSLAFAGLRDFSLNWGSLTWAPGAGEVRLK